MGMRIGFQVVMKSAIWAGISALTMGPHKAKSVIKGCSNQVSSVVMLSCAKKEVEKDSLKSKMFPIVHLLLLPTLM
jgi:hypothetical protein